MAAPHHDREYRIQLDVLQLTTFANYEITAAIVCSNRHGFDIADGRELSYSRQESVEEREAIVRAS